ncbi:MAG TPA: hypothetical protein VLT33_36875 [Labilithrix sp.]|nr:hypothetical protein [Labilithrix sp.]
MRSALVIAVAVSLAPAFLSAPARAQSNYRLAPVGGRTTLVGGTGLAYGRDSASAFLNPATVVRVDPGRLSFSVNFYELSLFSSKSWYQPGPVDRARFGDLTTDAARVTTFGFDTLPGSLCVFLRVGELRFLSRTGRKELGESQARLGLCLASVQNQSFTLNREDYLQQNGSGGTRQAQAVSQSFRRIAIGPTYAMYVSNALVLGASIHFSRAGYRSSFESTTTSTGPGSRSITSAFFNSAHGDSYDVNATIGATYRIGRLQTVALVLEAPSLHAFGSGGLNHYTHYEGAGDATSTTTAQGSFAAYTPLRLGLGTGIHRSWGTAEVNVSYHLPLGSAYRATLAGRGTDIDNGAVTDRDATLDLSRRGRGVVNIGVGGEIAVAPYISVLAGVGTDLSTVKSGTLASDPMTYFPSNTNRLTSSFGVGSHGEGGALLIGGELSYEWGDRLAVNSYQLPARFESVSTQSFGLLLVVAGTTSYKNITRAITDLGKAVDPTTGQPVPPKPVPPKPAPPRVAP